FATAMRVLEALAEVPKQMDLRAVTEAACFGFPLGDRTPYQGVRALRAAEVVQVSGAGVARSQYWRWDDIRSARRPQQELLQEAYDRFTAAVACRRRGDRTTTAFLSGGLDSRCVVAALRAQGAEVHAFNFALPGTQDRILGAACAAALGARHHQGTMRPDVELRFSALLADALSTPEHCLAPPPEHPRVVWSGEGGSVGVGYVYLTRGMVDQLRAGDPDGAIAAFLERQKAAVLRKLLRPAVADAVAYIPRRGIREEIDDLRCADPGRSLHLCLPLNDQRRHLAGHRFPRDLLSKSVLRVAGWIYRTGLRDYGYVIQHASLYYTYWERSGGRWVAPGTAPASPPPTQDATGERRLATDALTR